jgi:Fic family protein
MAWLPPSLAGKERTQLFIGGPHADDFATVEAPVHPAQTNIIAIVHAEDFWDTVEECVRLSLYSGCIGVVDLESGSVYKIVEKATVPSSRYRVLYVTATLSFAEMLTAIEAAKNVLKQHRPISQESPILSKLLLEFTHQSVTIEGNTLSFDETKVLAEILTKDPAHATTDYEISGSEKEKLEMTNHLILVGKFEELIKKEVTEELILEVHKTLMAGLLTGESGPGEYRKSNIAVSGSKVLRCLPIEIGWRMTALFQKIRDGPGDQHLVEFVCEVFCEFQRIHPFRDGNGRVRRLIVNFLLSQNGYPIISIPPELKLLYGTAIENYNTEKRSLFLRFIAECLWRSFI